MSAAALYIHNMGMGIEGFYYKSLIKVFRVFLRLNESVSRVIILLHSSKLLFGIFRLFSLS